MAENLCRWGLMSTALIGQKNWQAIHYSGNGVVAAVASRSVDKAQEFIDRCQKQVPFNSEPQAFGSYEEMLASDQIDAVYVPLPTGLRKDWVVRAAEAGKHVMCEKPCARNLDELKEMVDACEKNGVQFMDGVMYMHTDRLASIRETLDSGRLGKLKRIATQFSFCADQDFHDGNIRTNSDLEPQGCLGDLGWYTIRFALFVMNYQKPRKVTATMIHDFQRPDSPQPVPMEVEVRLEFDGDVTATFYNSFLTGHQQWAHISGTEGHLAVRDFVLPYHGDRTEYWIARPEFTTEGCSFKMTENAESFELVESGDSAHDAQETKLFQCFAQNVVQQQPDGHWPRISLLTQELLDACMESALSGQTVELS